MGTDCKDCNIESFMCNTCGVTMGLNREFTAKLRESHKSFVCPNGHSLAWNAPSAKEKEEEKLREEVKELKTKIETLSKELTEKNDKIKHLENELEIWRSSSEEKKAS